MPKLNAVINVSPLVSMFGAFELLEAETAGAGVIAAGLFAASDAAVSTPATATAAGVVLVLVLVPMPRVRADSRVLEEARVEEMGTADDDDAATALDDTGTTDTLELLALAAAVEAAAWVVFVDASAGLLAQGIVTYTVCVTVSGRRLTVCVGPAPEPKTVVVRKEKGAFFAFAEAVVAIVLFSVTVTGAAVVDAVAVAVTVCCRTSVTVVWSLPS